MALQNRLGLSQTRSLDLFQDRSALRLPAIGDGFEVVMGEVDVDRGDEFTDAGETALSDDIVGELAKKALDQIEPRGTRRREVNVHARVLFQPRADRGMFVRGVVVDDQMQGQSSRSLPVQLFKEAQPFDIGMARRGRAQDLPVEIVEGGEQRDGAMAGVVVSPGADVAHTERQPRLSAFECLTLALFIAAKNEGSVRRIEVKADHVPELRLKVGIAGQFEGSGQVGLDVVGGPNPLHARRRNPHLSGHRAHAPARPVRRRLRRLRDQLVLLRLRDRRFGAATGSVLDQSLHPKRRETPRNAAPTE